MMPAAIAKRALVPADLAVLRGAQATVGKLLGKRREASAAALDLRLTSADRSAPPSGGAGGARAKSANRAPQPVAKSKPPRGRQGKSGKRLSLGRLIYWGAVLALWGSIALAALFGWVALHLPPIQSLEIPRRPPSVQINAAGGHVFATRGEMGGAAIRLKDMPAHLPNAFIAIEDRRFYSHHGIDPIGLVRAVLANVLHRGISQGGSTITQQLAKNLFLTPERNLMRKLQEVVLAIWLEHKFTKSEILELYLNRVYFGTGAYGVEAAAQRYFGKSARQVMLAEAALLAGLVKSPTRLAPTKNFEAAERRGQIVLAAMADAGLITEAAAKTAMTVAPTIVKPSAGGSSNYVADWVLDVLDDVVGHLEEDLVVDTTIDAAMQAAAERSLIDELAQKGEKSAVGQGALVAMTPDGAVRALVGGRNYVESQFNRAVAAKRQPGSAFKPFVYLTAIEHGLTPDTVRDDRPIEVKGWRPENFNREYAGPVTLSQALARSLNSVSVRLALEFSPTAVVRTAHRLGISSKLEPNASIALGTSEVSLLELVTAYAPFANGGIAVIPRVVERVRSANGKIIYARAERTLGRVVDPHAVAQMNAMMRETVTSGTARKAELPGWAPAGKTGTSQDFRDGWFIGYTGDLVTGVWLGNDDNAPTRKMTGGSLPVEVWSAFMKAAHRGKAPADLAPANPPDFPAGNEVSATNAGATSARPIPPASVPGGRGKPPAADTIDGWFLDRLFSR
jgi:penicillin-binding protein 1A